MTETLSENTKAVLLLTAPLITGRGHRSPDLLSPGEYKRLAFRLRETGGEPANLIGPSANLVLDDLAMVVEKSRLERLLGRGFLLSQALEHWHARALWVLSRADAVYPQRLKARLKEDSPPILYGSGEKTLLNGGGLAVVGSRRVEDALIGYAQDIGRLAASSRRTLLSGGARGIDQAAMRGALEGGGRVIGVMADSLERTALNREHRNHLLEGQLVLVSPYDPGAGFNVGHAMQRNKLIYALADAALVVSAEANKGGTWAGATEQLEKLHFVPVYVRSTDEPSRGLDALKEKGAQPWPNPTDPETFDAVLTAAPRESSVSREEQSQSQLSFEPQAPASETIERRSDLSTVGSVAPQEHPSEDPDRHLADELFQTVRSLLLRILREPKKAADVAAALEVSQRQAEQWLKRLVDEDILQKSKKPVRYSIREGRLFSIEGSGDRKKKAAGG